MEALNSDRSLNSATVKFQKQMVEVIAEKDLLVTAKINKFLQKNPDAFSEFKTMEKASLSSVRELTKNDSW